MHPPNNLPLQLSSFIGREREMTEVKRLLGTSRLLTLTGAGGTGKTRLAVQVGSQVESEYDGVFFVDMAPTTDSDLVLPTVAKALEVKETPGQTLIEALKAYLQGKELLLLLDNFEQVVGATVLLVDLLLSVPGLKMLVTSRAPLHLQGEQLYQVPPLELPEATRQASVEELLQKEAVALFIERAKLVQPDFDLSEETAPVVAQICSRLDGLPLAIELAAARINVLTPQAMLPRLDSRLRLLTGGAHDLPTRQQTLKNTIDWSYNLLSRGEQQLFRRMAVFSGGRTLRALEAVCDFDGSLGVDVLEGTSALIDKNLLQPREDHAAETRFAMLETIHEYASEKLQESGEEGELRSQHLAYFTLLAEEADGQIETPEQVKWMNQLADEHDNFRTALTWALAEEPGMALRLASLLGRFWHLSGYLSEGRRWLEKSLAKDTPGRQLDRTEALNWLGTLAWAQGNYEEAITLHAEGLLLGRKLKNMHAAANALLGIGTAKRWLGRFEEAAVPLEDSLKLFREIEDKHGTAHVLNRLGLVALDAGDLQRAGMLLEESLALSREVGSKTLLAAALNNLGSVLRSQGEYARAMSLFEESLLLLRSVGARVGIVQPLVNLAIIALRQGNYEQAKPLLREGLRLSRDLGTTIGTAWCLFGLASSASAEGHSERAGRLYGVLNALNVPILPTLRVEYERDVGLARARLDEDTWQAAWEEGRVMSMEQAIAYALEDIDETERAGGAWTAAAPGQVYPNELTRREVEVLRLVAEGHNNAQIAERLFLSTNTVRAHLYSTYSKIDVSNRMAAARFVQEHRLM
jgi:predicted ATPase/DNA-binding CsgD family transcriptional regulator